MKAYKEGRTRLVLTHPNWGCLLHDKCLYSFERGSELEYKSFYYFINYRNCIISRLNDSIILYGKHCVNVEPLPNDLNLFRKKSMVFDNNRWINHNRFLWEIDFNKNHNFFSLLFSIDWYRKSIFIDDSYRLLSVYRLTTPGKLDGWPAANIRSCRLLLLSLQSCRRRRLLVLLVLPVLVLLLSILALVLCCSMAKI